jgi:MraZ protein
MVLRGAHAVTLDTKGRLIVPAKVRAEVPCSEWIITLDIHEPCLLGYPLAVWEGIEKALLDLPNVDKDVRALQRWLVGNATSVVLDAQGRLLIPRVLCDHARLQKEVIWVGLGQKFELWDEMAWKAEGQHFKSIEKTAQGEVWQGLKL